MSSSSKAVCDLSLSRLTFALGLHTRVGAASAIQRAWRPRHDGLGELRVIELIFSFLGKAPSYPLLHPCRKFDVPGLLTVHHRPAITANGEIYVAQDNTVCVFDQQGQRVRTLGTTEGKADGTLKLASAVAVSPTGQVYVADRRGNCVQQFDERGRFVRTLARLDCPAGITYNHAQGTIMVASLVHGAIFVYAPCGRHVGTLGRRGYGEGEFSFPSDVKVAPDGNVVIADTNNHRIQVLTPQGEVVRMVPVEYYPQVIDVDEAGNILVLRQQGISVYSPKGDILQARLAGRISALACAGEHVFALHEAPMQVTVW